LHRQKSDGRHEEQVISIRQLRFGCDGSKPIHPNPGQQRDGKCQNQISRSRVPFEEHDYEAAYRDAYLLRRVHWAVNNKMLEHQESLFRTIQTPLEMDSD
jgi:hypothetical protein